MRDRNGLKKNSMSEAHKTLVVNLQKMGIQVNNKCQTI
jgi:hypothetical protein